MIGKQLSEFFLPGLLIVAFSALGIFLAFASPQFVLPVGWTFVFIGLAFAAALYLWRTVNQVRAREATLTREIAAREAELKNLWQAGLDVTDAQDYTQILRTVVDRARELIDAEASALCLWDEQKNWWVLQGASGAPDAFEVTVHRISPRAGAPAVECPVIRFKYRQAHLDVPVMRGNEVIGCLCVANQAPREFSAREHELVSGIAAQAARALDHARRLETIGNQAVSRERELMSRELHDTVAQLLGFVGFKTEAVRELLGQGQIAQAEQQLEQLASLAQELYADTREIILGLSTKVTPERDWLDALHDYIQRFSEFSNIATTLDTTRFDGATFTPTAQVQIMRVVQEALSNIRKHARTKIARVTFERAGEFAEIRIEDDGQGFDPTNIQRGVFPQFGLQAMRERAETIGGALTINSVKAKGTTVRVRIPLVQRGT